MAEKELPKKGIMGKLWVLCVFALVVVWAFILFLPKMEFLEFQILLLVAIPILILFIVAQQNKWDPSLPLNDNEVLVKSAMANVIIGPAGLSKDLKTSGKLFLTNRRLVFISHSSPFAINPYRMMSGNQDVDYQLKDILSVGINPWPLIPKAICIELADGKMKNFQIWGTKPVAPLGGNPEGWLVEIKKRIGKK